jgi:hypothetical protein
MTHTETMDAKTGLVQVTSARRAVMETGSFVSVLDDSLKAMGNLLEPAETDSMT